MSRLLIFPRCVAALSVVALMAGVLTAAGFATPATSNAAPSVGSAYTWGSNTQRQLGNGTAVSSSSPVAVTTSGALSGKSIAQLSGAGASFCALDTAGAVYCWGDNGQGTLGDGTTTTREVPVAVDTSGALAGKTVTQIATLTDSTCALTSDGLVFCWGNNSSGQLGNGTTDDTNVPVPVNTAGVLSGRSVMSLSTSGDQTYCAILDDDSIACWGSSSMGQLGNGTLNPVNSSPTLVTMSGVLNGKTPISISGGYFHMCTLTSDGTVACWGDNDDGQLGNGSATDANLPVAVDTSELAPGTQIGAVQASGYSTCVITTVGKAHCWGDNRKGQLGNGTITNALVPPANSIGGVLAGQQVASISLSEFAGCATTVSGRAACWGDGALGRLGQGSTDSSLTPIWVDTSGVLSSVHVEQVATALFGAGVWGRAANGCATPSAAIQLGGIYQLGTPAHLMWLRDDSTLWDDSFAMVGDIDMAGCAWSTTIGDDTTAFTGIFDGNGHTISNIDVDMSSASTLSVGLFGQAGAGHEIRDLTVTGDVSGTALSQAWEVYVGGVVGNARGGVIDGVTFEGTVTATGTANSGPLTVAGGVVGLLFDDTVTNSAVTRSTVTAEKGDPTAGGLVGRADDGSGSGTQTWIHDSYVWATLVESKDQTGTSQSVVGGIVGEIDSWTAVVEVVDSFARGIINLSNPNAGARGVGGIVGKSTGGLIDQAFADVTINLSGFTSSVYRGRIAGFTSGVLAGADNFWNSDIDGPANAIGIGNAATLTASGVSESAMQTMSTFANAGWAIVNTYEPPGANIWGICEGQSYPYLLWAAQTLTTPGNPCSTTPTIAGTAVVGESLVGSFTTPLDVQEYRWWRVDAQGNDEPLVDYDETYVVSAADVGSRLKVEGTAFENGIVTTVFSALTAVVPDPTPPTPPTPAGPPQDVSATAGDGSVTVTWETPASTGSFPVSQYQMQASPGGASCLVEAPALSCVISGLTNGQTYTVRGRALTGAGWSTFSAASAPVTPGVQQTIVITGSRDGRTVRVEGVTTGMVGQQVAPWFRFAGQTSYAEGSARRTVDEQGEFTWQRRAAKKIYVFFRAGDDVRSNRVIIPAR